MSFDDALQPRDPGAIAANQSTVSIRMTACRSVTREPEIDRVRGPDKIPAGSDIAMSKTAKISFENGARPSPRCGTRRVHIVEDKSL
jgi:hypothetical protein